MNQNAVPSHVALLVPSVRKAADYLRQFDFKMEKEQEFAGEGTREIYVEKDKSNSLLLMEPLQHGPYHSALQKRGPGIHHLAIDVLDIEKFLSSIRDSGWLLHLASLTMIKESRTAYLARPGFRGLIEVQEKKKLIEKKLFVENVMMDITPKHSVMLQALGLEKIVRPQLKKSSLTLLGNDIEIEKLF